MPRLSRDGASYCGRVAEWLGAFLARAYTSVRLRPRPHRGRLSGSRPSLLYPLHLAKRSKNSRLVSAKRRATTSCATIRLAKQAEFVAFSRRIFRAIEDTMATKNPLPPVEVTLSLNSQTAWYLDRLVETGLYGNNRAEAARIAVYDHCKLLVADAKLVMAPITTAKESIPVS